MITLRPEYQQPAHDATIEHCRKTNEPAIINQTVGAGKTIQIGFAAKHIADKGGRVLVLARQGELVEQNSDDYRLIGGKCSIYSASLNRRSTYYPVVFGTEGTIARELDGDFRDLKFNALLIDECHMVDWQDAMLEQPESQYGKIIKHLVTANPKLRIIGYTGSPFRNNKSIVGDFWKAELSTVGTYQLVSLGYLVPPVFGFGDDAHTYDLGEYRPKAEQQSDYSQKELQAMGRKITKETTKTQLIMEEVVARTQDRNGVLITCASLKHCEQVAECLPLGTWGIITDKTSTKKRRELLAKAKSGEIKYMMQIGCLTTGVNVPLWDTCVILRRIGSLVLLIQLIGRVLRTLKDNQLEEGLTKSDGLVLDYTDTMESFGDIHNPIVEKAAAEKAKQRDQDLLCPKCGSSNSIFAVRCIGVDANSDDGRCEHFFKSNECGVCGAENAPSARTCRKCDAIMIDPNKALIRKAYTDADYKPVVAMHFGTTQSGKLSVTYQLDSTYHHNGIEKPEVAKEYYDIASKQPHEKGRWYGFVKQHINGYKFQQSMMRNQSLENVIRNKAMFDCPSYITHRKNDKGFSVINRRKFRSGRETTAN
jgi:DNA repair protein RadD